MPKALPFFKFDADAWLTGKIQILSALEKGIFVDLAARIWKENGSLKNTEVLHRLLRVPKATLNKSLDAFFQLGIMCEKDGVLSVKFIDEQLEQRREYIANQREVGRRGGRPKKGSKPIQKAESRKQKAEKKIIHDVDESPSCISPTTTGKPVAPGRSSDKIFFDYDGDRRLHGIGKKQLAMWKEIYDALDVEEELRKASAWLDANKRKIDIKKFLVNWLNKAQDHSRPAVGNDKPARGAGEGEWRV